MAEKITFNEGTIEALPSSDKGRTYYYDKKVPGLCILVTHTGSKSFYLYRKVKGVAERIHLGKYPAMKVKQAISKAMEYNGLLSMGENPAQIRRAFREEWTLQQLFNDYLEKHAKVHKKSWEKDEAQFDHHLSKLAKRKASQVTRQDIKSLHHEIGIDQGSPIAANRVLALVSAIYNYAIDGLEMKLTNPARGIGRFEETSRERFIQPHELEGFFKALDAMPNETMRDFFLIALLTGARRSNVQAMQWDHISFESKTWTIPGKDMKTKNSHVIPLISEANEILERRRNGSKWVFPSKGKSGHIVEPKKAWQGILKAAGIADLRIHDLRRSMGSWQASTGASLSVIGRTLNHQKTQTTAIYARLHLDPVRQAMETAASAMLSIGKAKEQAENAPVVEHG